MTNIKTICPEFRNITENEQTYYTFDNEDRRILIWLGKKLHNSFMPRRELPARYVLTLLQFPKHTCTYTEGIYTLDVCVCNLSFEFLQLNTK